MSALAVGHERFRQDREAHYLPLACHCNVHTETSHHEFGSSGCCMPRTYCKRGSRSDQVYRAPVCLTSVRVSFDSMHTC